MNQYGEIGPIEYIIPVPESEEKKLLNYALKLQEKQGNFKENFDINLCVVVGLSSGSFLALFRLKNGDKFTFEFEYENEVSWCKSIW